MRQGHDRTDVDYAWPPTLRRDGITLIYLDLNHWISLAKAWSGHQHGRPHKTLLAACINAVAAGQVIFPLSSIIYFEIANIRNHRQRQDLRRVIEVLSRFRVITSRPIIATHEMEAALDDIGLRNPRPLRPTSYLDWGVLRALGLCDDLKFVDEEGGDRTEEVRNSYTGGPHAFDRYIAKQYIQLNRDIIDGPAPEQQAKFRSGGWRAQATLSACKGTAEAEAELDRKLNAMPQWRRGRIRDVIAAHEVANEINEILYSACKDRHIQLTDIGNTREKMRQVFDAMPSFDVAVTLKTACHRNSAHRWKYNDIYDIQALAPALPYCDIVMTDKAMETQIRQSGLTKRLNTTVSAQLSDLNDFL